jgi:CheY-like chemotaxis protein
LRQLLPFLDSDAALKAGNAHKTDRVKVLVADPFKLFRQALVRCFEDREDVQVVGAVDSPEAYRRALESAAFDVAVVASDFLEGTRTTRELRPGDNLLDGQGEAHTSGSTADVPLVVLLADEDLEESRLSVGTPAPPLWEPGRFVRGKRVSIPRGAPVEMLVEAISIVAEKKVGAGMQAPHQTGPFYAGQQPQTWP